MKIYEKPVISIDDLVADTKLANDPYIDSLNDTFGDELSVPVGDGWDDFLD
ncbi:MAG: hypothetical protein IJA41_05355 [Clostridia bacterium]|nr:hypothetical protein [Clostridia bacterium]